MVQKISISNVTVAKQVISVYFILNIFTHSHEGLSLNMDHGTEIIRKRGKQHWLRITKCDCTFLFRHFQFSLFMKLLVKNNE